MANEWLSEILSTISDLNENNIIERVKEELEEEDPDTYKKWQDNGFNINYTFDVQSRLLHIAARNDLVKIAELLIKKGGNVNTADQDGCTLLHCAAINGHEEIVKLLLDKGADVTSVGCVGSTVLHHAVSSENCQVEIVKAILEKGASVNVVDEYESTPLCWAIRHGHLAVVEVLLKEGADPFLGHKSFNTLKPLVESIKNDFKHPKKVEETQQQDDEYELIKYSLLHDCSLIDSIERSAFSKLIPMWLVDGSNLTENQKELNRKFLTIIKGFPHITYQDNNNDIKKN